ncbi:MAG TPA: putative cytokinetic ring protein SteA, partial [Gaiellaceae bacterium]|nr:putative cytokinetic ring protein SteA [Gaiellaceae bacterium]
ACRAGAVVNASPSSSGRYPNLGPEILVNAGIPLVDDTGREAMDAVVEGEILRLEDGVLYRGSRPIGKGVIQTPDLVAETMELARAGLEEQLKAFVENTLTYVEQEYGLLLDAVGVPDIATDLEGRHCLIVVRGYHYREDIATLRPYIREYRPVLIGVDGGADALLEAGYTPHMIVGDMDSVSDAGLRCGAELVVHAYAEGHAPGEERLSRLGLPFATVSVPGISEDAALLLAHDKGAELIVAVGTHFNLVEFLERNRAGMSSTFVTRLKVGEILVDAKGVSQLVSRRVGLGPLLAVGAAGVTAIVVAIAASPALRNVFTDLATRLPGF